MNRIKVTIGLKNVETTLTVSMFGDVKILKRQVEESLNDNTLVEIGNILIRSDNISYMIVEQE